MSKEQYTETDENIIATNNRRGGDRVLPDKGGTNPRTDMLLSFQTEGSDLYRNAWENLEWKGLTTLDTGLVVIFAKNWYLRVSPREDRAGVTDVLSPISFKL